jgi:hypothetical protein
LDETTTCRLLGEITGFNAQRTVADLSFNANFIAQCIFPTFGKANNACSKKVWREIRAKTA